MTTIRNLFTFHKYSQMFSTSQAKTTSGNRSFSTLELENAFSFHAIHFPFTFVSSNCYTRHTANTNTLIYNNVTLSNKYLIETWKSPRLLFPASISEHLTRKKPNYWKRSPKCLRTLWNECFFTHFNLFNVFTFHFWSYHIFCFFLRHLSNQ